MDSAPGLTPHNNDHAIQMPHQLPVAERPPANLPLSNLPLSNLLNGTRDQYVNICVPLYEASMKGDWKAAKMIIDDNTDVVRSSITENNETALHVAASAKSTAFVESLVAEMRPEDMILQNNNYNTALCLAAAAGTTEMAESMVKKNPAVLITQGSNEMMPLYMAALFGNRKMVRYLYDNSRKLRDDHWTDVNRGWLLVACLQNDMFDIALDILGNHPEVHDSMYALQALAKKTDAFNGTKRNAIQRLIHSIARRLKLEGVEEKNQALEALTLIWKHVLKKSTEDIGNIIRGPREDIRDSKGNVKVFFPSRALFLAAETGNSRFIIQLIRTYPDLIWKTDEDNRSIFHIAVIHRQESVYNLLYEIGSMKDLITPLKDNKDNNMLHLAARKAKPSRLQIVSGVALQMQRELQWFEEVKTMIPPSYRERKNKANQTPQELFTEEHRKLVEDGETWMKDTANQCMVVAALIATMVFAAAFTVPGGYNQESGIPIFLRNAAFMVFVISDAVSLFSSSTAILMFLSILTSRYAEQDFLESLPKKLLMGLATLFLSITTMMVAFSSSFFVIYTKELKWAPILITVFAGVPVILYALLQYHLLVDVVRSTFGSRYIFKPNKHALY